jgi:RHS repeat-associated protein
LNSEATNYTAASMVANGGAASAFVNNGTLVKNAGSGAGAMQWALDNRGTMNAQAGQFSIVANAVLESGSVLVGSIAVNAAVTAGDVQGADASVTLSGSWSENAGATSALGNLSQSGGSLTGAGELDVSGSFVWSGGAMSGTGQTVLGWGSSGTINPGATSRVDLNSRTLVNDGSLTFPAGSILGGNGAQIVNNGLFAFNSEAMNYTAAALVANGGATPSFVNNGALVKTAGAGTSATQWLIDNEGAVRAQSSGQLAFAGGGSPSTNGSWAASGAGSSINFQAGTFAVGQSDSWSGVIAITGGSLSSGAIQNPQGNVALSGGTLSLSDSSTPSVVAGLSETGGSLAGAGELDVSGSFAWSGGTMSGSGETVVGSGVSGMINPSASWRVDLNGRTLVNGGSLTFASGSLFGENGAQIVNDGSFALNSEATNYTAASMVANGGAASAFVNNGTLVKNAGSGAGAMQWLIDNEGSGTVASSSGSLTFSGGDLGALPSNQNPLTGGLGSTGEQGQWLGSGTGTINFSGGNYWLGTGIRMTGQISLSGASVTAQSINAPSASLSISSNTLNVADVAATSTIGNVNLVGGKLTGAGPVNVSGQFVWSGGMLSGAGTTTLEPSAVGSINPVGSVTLDARNLVNEGALTWSSGTLYGGNGAQLANLNTFTANSQTGSMAVSGAGAPPLLYNAPDALIQKTAGTGTTEIDWVKALAGQVNQGTGTIHFGGPSGTLVPIAGEVNGPGNPAAPQRPNCSATTHPVNCATGNQFEQQTDLAVGGHGPGLALSRTYDSQAAAAATSPGVFGYGWSATYSDHLVIDSQAALAVVYQADGSSVPFTIAAGAFTAPSWAQSRLAGNANGTYSYTLPDQATFVFAANGRLQSESDRNANAVTLAYNSLGQLASATDGAGRAITFVYDASGRIDEATDPTGENVSYTYDANGNLSSVASSALPNLVWQFAYDSSHELISETDANGHTTTTVYDTLRRVTAQTDPMYRTTRFSYVPHTDGDTETQITQPGGDVTDEIFQNYEPIQVTHAYGTSLAATQTTAYNAAGAPLSSTDGDGHVTSYAYDAAGNRTSVTDSAGRTTRLTYDGARDVTSQTTPMGETTTITRDSRGNVTSVARPAPGGQTQTTSYAYDANGDQTSMIDPDAHTWTYAYDSAGDQTSATTPTGDQTTTGYDADSRAISVTAARGNASGASAASYTTTITRNGLGQATQVTDPLGNQTSDAYDAVGNKTSQTDARGATTTTTYSADDEPVAVIRPDGSTQQTGYDLDGQVVSQTNGTGHATTYTRNALEQITRTTDPLGRSTVATYDSAGNLSSTTDAMGRATSYTYDPVKQLTGISYPDTSTPSATYTYDANRERTSMTDGTGTTSYTYDQLGRLTQTTDGAGNTTSYQYDLDGNQTQITYPNSHNVTDAYNNAGELTSTADWLGNTISYGYDPDGNPTTTTFPTGTAEVDTTTFDNADQPASVSDTTGATVLASQTYTRDPAGHVTAAAQTFNAGATANLSFSYNSLNRLAAATTGTYAYDQAGDPTTQAGVSGYAYNTASQLTSQPANITLGTPATTVAYDSLGERTTSTPATGAVTTDGYDVAQTLTSVTRTLSGSTPAISETNTYNGDGLLQTTTNAGTASQLTWDTAARIPLLLADNGTSLIYGPGGLAIEQITSGGTVTYLHHDQQGSTGLTTSTTGATLSTATYDPYGNLLSSTGTQTILGYQGQLSDPATGLIYLRARWYDPSTAQFLTQDPLQALTQEPYAYASNNPISNSDPTGLCADPTGALCTFAGAISGTLNATVRAVVNHAGQIIAVGGFAACVYVTAGVCAAILAGGGTANAILIALKGGSTKEQAVNAVATLAGLVPAVALARAAAAAANAGVELVPPLIERGVNAFVGLPSAITGLLPAGGDDGGASSGAGGASNGC